MRAVVYDHEGYEPLTVIDVPQRFMREIESGKRAPELVFPAYEPIAMMSPTPVMDAKVKTVRLRFEPVFRGSGAYARGDRPFLWLCTTDDGETALLLRAAFLPGQQRELQGRVRRAFLAGLMAATGA
jgi:hypothetical protein